MTAEQVIMDCADRVAECGRVPGRAVRIRCNLVCIPQSVSYATVESTFGGIVRNARRMRLHGAMLALRRWARAAIAIAAIHKTLMYN